MMSTETNSIKISTSIKQLITARIASSYQVIPVKEENDSLVLATHKELLNDELKEELEVVLGKNIQFIIIAKEELEKKINFNYPQGAKNSAQTQQLGSSDDFLERIISEALQLKSSDIHIEAFEKSGRVRYRVDGKLLEQFIIPSIEYPSLVNKVKIAAKLDISEKRLPQDGRISIQLHEVNIDIRVSVLPSLYGEKVVLRLLVKDKTKIELDHLGLNESEMEVFLKHLQKKQGMVLVSGPTGSGKTTTLYAALKKLNKEDTNILTVEDPIEYTIDGVTQVQLRENIGLSFTKVLKTFLRQDPDIIMIGEIRDVDTANIAIRAALTGHLVLSTIHTNSAWATISRLIDMGVPSFLIADTLNMSVAQRLVRVLCPDCKKKVALLEQQKKQKELQSLAAVYEPIGCEKCYQTGYVGRKAIYEIIPIDEDLVSHIRTKQDETPKELMNYTTLKDKALDLLVKGETSLEEVYAYLL